LRVQVTVADLDGVIETVIWHTEIIHGYRKNRLKG